MEIKWPDGATYRIDGIFRKWVDGFGYNLEGECWVKNKNSWSPDRYCKSYGFKVIERPIDPPYVPEVGDRCEHANPEFAAHYGKLSYIGLSQGGAMIMESEGSDLLRFSAGAVFRPIKTELDQFIEKGIEINRSLTIGATETEMFVALFEAGFKAPE